MPLSNYYGGRGEKVMRDMMRKYGAKKGKQVFYATANRRKKKRQREQALRGMRR